MGVKREKGLVLSRISKELHVSCKISLVVKIVIFISPPCPPEGGLTLHIKMIYTKSVISNILNSICVNNKKTVDYRMKSRNKSRN
jgi:hypothetical protein